LGHNRFGHGSVGDLDGCEGVEMKITFIVGIGEDEDGNPLPTALVESSLQVAYLDTAKAFGGYTAYRGKGGWIDPSHKLIQEDSVTIVVYTDTIIAEAIAVAHAEYLRDLFRQSSVLVSFEPTHLTKFV
jgi:hypothetical protein